MFSCEIVHNGKSWVSVFQEFSASINKALILEGDWALSYHSMEFKQFPDISYFPKILSFKSFGNSFGNLYIPCL